jgi:hypothetical protein
MSARSVMVIVPQNLVRAHGNGRARGVRLAAIEFEDSALGRTGVMNSGAAPH